MLLLYMCWIGLVEKSYPDVAAPRPITRHTDSTKCSSRAAVAIQTIHVQVFLAQVEEVNCPAVHFAMKQYCLLYICNGCRYAEWAYFHGQCQACRKYRSKKQQKRLSRIYGKVQLVYFKMSDDVVVNHGCPGLSTYLCMDSQLARRQ